MSEQTSHENTADFMGYGSDLPLTDETQAEVTREKAYQDFNYDLQARLHETYMLVNDEMDKHATMSREWQELYTISRLVNTAADMSRLHNDRSKRYAEVPF